MDGLLFAIEALVVVGAIVMGTKSSGVALGIWGGVGVAVLVFVFGVDPGSPPVDAILIILAVILAAADDAGGGRHRLDGRDGGESDPEPSEVGHDHRPVHVVPVLPRRRDREHRLSVASGHLRRVVTARRCDRSVRCR